MEFATNGRRIQDIEDSCKSMPNNYVWRDFTISTPDYDKIHVILGDMAQRLKTDKNHTRVFRELQRKYHYTIKPSYFTRVYRAEVLAGRMEQNLDLENALITSKCRGISGVTVITVFLSPYPEGQAFTCKWNCSYCPNEPGQPRSYLFGEPGVLRANQNGFDCVKQMLARIQSYAVNGHPTDKFEVLILGGTIHSYPKTYLETFMRDIFYAANICSSTDRRDPLSIDEEKRLNNLGTHRVIGVTVETRPDCINAKELQDFRRWGVTRVQIGVQHTDDEILRKVNRGCLHKHTVRALKLLKDACFKVDIHIMPNLPGATPMKDKAMIDVVLNDLQPDQVKVYPCETTPFTKILEDYKAGTYVPYDDNALEEVVLYWKTNVHPWIRNNRIVRDIPNNYIVAGMKTSSQRNEYRDRMKELGLTCRCIRCRESGRHPEADPHQGELVVRSFHAQGRKEYFISWESSDRTVLFGFLRLRVPSRGTDDSDMVFPELLDHALIRELHVYGRTVPVGNTTEETPRGNVTASQHLGIGRRLLEAAENLAKYDALEHIAVISGVGVRSYYERVGYSMLPGKGEFLAKSLKPKELNLNLYLSRLATFGPFLYYIIILVWILYKKN